MSDPGPTLSGFTTCPVLLSHRTEVTIGHGGGVKLTQELIDRVFRPAFANDALAAQHDGALLHFPGGGALRDPVSRAVGPLAQCCRRGQ